MTPDLDFLCFAEARHFYSASAKADIGINQREVKRRSTLMYFLQDRAKCFFDKVAWLCETFAGKQEQLSTSFSQTPNRLSPLYSSGARGANDQVNVRTAGMILGHPGTVQAFAHGTRRWGGFEPEGALPWART
jgi:hypothetical protein